MLQNEFANLMGIDPELLTEQEYLTANAMYEWNETDDVCHDKSEFCDRWKEFKDNGFFMAAVRHAMATDKKVYELCQQMEKMHETHKEEIKQWQATVDDLKEQLYKPIESPELTEPQRVYLVNRTWEKGENHTCVEEVARFYSLNMASLFLKALCNQPNYKTEVDFEHLDRIWAVKAVWTGGGEAHNYAISEEYLKEDGTIDEWA